MIPRETNKSPNVEGNKPVQPPKGVKVQQIPCGYRPKYEGLCGAVAFGLQRGRVLK